MRACKWCTCNFCFVGKRDSNIRVPEKFLNVVDIFMSGYHADTPITIKAEPFIWPTAAFINIHEHPL